MLRNTMLSAFRQTAFILTFSAVSLQAAPQRPNPGYYQNDQQATALREMRDSIETLRHSVGNQETEIRTFEEKLENLDSIIEGVRDQISDTSRSYKDQLKGSATSLETKLTALETSVKGILTDLKQFQNYTTESTAALAQYKKKITDLEKSIEIQNQNIDDMQVAIKALMDVFQIKNPAPTKAPASVSAESLSLPASTSVANGSEITYKIKDGDSLEKIAKAHQTTVKAIKELNNLTNDRIVVGKTLKIPQK